MNCLSLIAKLFEHNVIIGGDMNAVINPHPDRSTNALVHSALINFLSNYALVDIWVFKNTK